MDPISLGNRELIVEMLDGTGDFQTKFHELEIQFRGLTPTVAETETNHVWQFVRREIAGQHYPRGNVFTAPAWESHQLV